ncbi:hypothetical protein LLG95_14285 [bacterium]|nr:hypothetical protein [bacterium]
MTRFKQPSSQMLLMFVWVSILCIVPSRAVDVKNPQPGIPVVFDEKNSLVWAPPIRIKPDRTTETLTGIQLNYTLNGAKRVWSLIGPKYPIGSQVIDIRYFSPRAAWIITRLGKEFGGAALLDLENQKVVKGYAINGPYSISPDHRFIAYTYPISAVPQDKAVFVNNVMIYPLVQLGANVTDDPRRYRGANATWMKKSSQPVGFIHNIGWWRGYVSVFLEEINRDKVQAAINGKTSGRFFNYSVSGFDEAFAAKKIQIAKLKTKRSETERWARSDWSYIYDKEHGEGAFDKAMRGISFEAEVNLIGRTELKDPANLKSRDGNVMMVRDKHYIGEKVFPKEKFYSLKIGTTKADAVRMFQEFECDVFDDVIRDENNKVQGGHLNWYTHVGFIFFRTYYWNLYYDKNSVIISKSVYEEKS